MDDRQEEKKKGREGDSREDPSPPRESTEQENPGRDEKEEKVRDAESEAPDSGSPEESPGEGSSAEPAVEPDADGGGTPHPFEELLDEYPLRDPSEDPVWSVRIVKGWMYFIAFNIAWIVLFLVLGIFYP